MPSLKQLAERKEALSPGHRACAGCGAPIALRQVLLSSDKPVVLIGATGCLEVTTTIFPFTAWNIPFLHNAFENAAATASGVEAMYKSLKKQGKYNKDVNVVVFGGDGGTYDIGLQSLSGAMERWHNLLYVCYNNEAYMNTGIQRSSATPLGASTTTAPAGKVKQGKEVFKKDLTSIIAAHNVAYVAQAVVGDWMDLTKKAEKAFSIQGPKFINIWQPCRLGWGYKPELTAEIGRLAVETCYWPLFEVIDGKWVLNKKPVQKKPVVELLKTQDRFRHLFKPGNEKLLQDIQEEVDRRWEELLVKCQAK